MGPVRRAIYLIVFTAGFLATIGQVHASAGPVVTTRPSTAASGATASTRPSTAQAAEETVPQLIGHLRDSDEGARRQAIRALAKAGAAAQPAMPQLAGIGRSDPGLRDEATQALSTIEDALTRQAPVQQYTQILRLEDATRALSSKNPAGRTLGLRFIGDRLGQAADLLPEVLPLLKDLNSRVRAEAAQACERAGTRGMDAVPALVPLLADWSPFVREKAGEALADIAPDDPQVITEMTRQLQSPYPDARGLAAWTLQRAGAAGKSALPELLRVEARDTDLTARANAKGAVVAIEKAIAAQDASGGQTPLDRITQGLVTRLRDRTLVDDERQQAAEMLANMGRRGAGATPALTEAAKHDRDPGVRAASAYALACVDRDPSAGVAALANLLEGSDFRAQMQAAQFVKRLGGAGVPLVPDLVDVIFTDHQGGSGGAAAEALREIDSVVASAPQFAAVERHLMDDLARQLKAAEPAARAAAADRLGLWTWRAHAMAPQLVAALKDKEPTVRRAAARALGRIYASPTVAKTPLTAALKDEDAQVRVYAAWSLAREQKHSPDAIAALTKELNSGDRAAELAACDSLARLGYKAADAQNALLEFELRERDLDVKQAAYVADSAIRGSISMHSGGGGFMPARRPGMEGDASGEDLTP